jgi:hypothetical protein
MTRFWYISNPKMTFGVETDDSNNLVITWAAPIAQKFLGQPLQNLEYWMDADAIEIGEE